MGRPRGIDAAFALFEEDTYGAAPDTPSGIKLRLRSCGVRATQTYQQDESLDGRTGKKPIPDVLDVAGPIVSEFTPEQMGLLFKHLLGSVDTTGASAPYTHVITHGALPTGFTLEQDYGARAPSAGRYSQFHGCKIVSGAFEFAGSGKVNASLELRGASQEYAADPLDATPTDLGHTPFSVFDLAIQEGGVAIAKVRSVSFNVTNSFDEEDYRIGGEGVRGSLDEDRVEISGEVTAVFDSMALLDKAMANTESSITITAAHGDGLGTAGNESVKLDLKQLVYSRQGPVIEGPAGVLVTLPFTGYGNGLEVTVLSPIATL